RFDCDWSSDVCSSDLAGGIGAILKTLSGKAGVLNTDCMTVTGKTLGENIAAAQVKDPDVIRPLDNPYSEKGGLAVLFGNLAPNRSEERRVGKASTHVV